MRSQLSARSWLFTRGKRQCTTHLRGVLCFFFFLAPAPGRLNAVGHLEESLSTSKAIEVDARELRQRIAAECPSGGQRHVFTIPTLVQEAGPIWNAE